MALTRAADEVDDSGRADHGKQEAAAASAEQQAPDQPGDQRAADADENRLPDRHRVTARNREAPEGTDDEAGDYKKNDERDHARPVPKTSAEITRSGRSAGASRARLGRRRRDRRCSHSSGD